MKLNIFLITFAAIVFAFFLQYERLFAIRGVNPNLMLIFLLLLAFSLKDLRHFLIFEALFFAVAVFWGYFWVQELLLVFGLALAARFLKNQLTGDIFADFLLSVVVSTLLFYGVVSLFFSASRPGFSILLGEIVYNFLVALLGWLIFFRFFRKIKVIAS